MIPIFCHSHAACTVKFSLLCPLLVRNILPLQDPPFDATDWCGSKLYLKGIPVWKRILPHFHIMCARCIDGIPFQQVTDIKRLNNMMSDHGIYSRERLLIPVSKPEILINSTCYIEVDTHAKREVAVLYLDGRPDRNLKGLLSTLTTERGKKRLIDSLKRCMHVDDGTAQYYLSLSNGDPRAAITQFSEDLRWERQAGFA